MTQPSVPPLRSPVADAARSDSREPRRVRSDDLLGGSQEIEIVHRSQCYRLRVTSLGKLILTK
jgi:hemin uptake protein HemP